MQDYAHPLPAQLCGRHRCAAGAQEAVKSRRGHSHHFHVFKTIARPSQGGGQEVCHPRRGAHTALPELLEKGTCGESALAAHPNRGVAERFHNQYCRVNNASACLLPERVRVSCSQISWAPKWCPGTLSQRLCRFQGQNLLQRLSSSFWSKARDDRQCRLTPERSSTHSLKSHRLPGSISRRPCWRRWALSVDGSNKKMNTTPT